MLLGRFDGVQYQHDAPASEFSAWIHSLARRAGIGNALLGHYPTAAERCRKPLNCYIEDRLPPGGRPVGDQADGDEA